MRVCIWLTCFSGAVLCAQVPERLTLDQARSMAMKNNPSVRAARFSALAANEQPAQVAAVRYPTVTASLTGAGAGENTRLAAGALNNPIIYSRVAGGFSINQLILDFGRTSRLEESSRFRAGAEQENEKATRAQVILETDRAYFEALRAEAILKVARQTVDARQLAADQVDELVKARLKSGLDASFANVQLAEAKLLLASAENQRKSAYARLSAVLGFSAPAQFELAEEAFHPVEGLAQSEMIQKAIRDRPDLAARRLESDAAGRYEAAEKALRFPTISANASAGYLPAHTRHLPNQYGAAGVNVSLPFLNGGAFKARQAEAAFRAHAADQRVRDLEAQIVRDVTIALLDLNTAAERVDLTTQLLDQAQLSLELAQSRYDLGLSTIVELSQAQLALTSAALQNVSAKYEYQIQRSVLAFHAGQLH